MKALLLFLLLFDLSNVYGQDSSITVIPQPVEIQQFDGIFVLSNSTTIGFNIPESRNIAEMLSQELNVPTGFSIKAQQSTTGTIQFILNKVPVEQIGKEGYTLVSSQKGVVITANYPAGLFYGMQTLLQLLPKEIESKSITNVTWTIPIVKIKDYPRFGWRGIMLDVSRNYFSKDDVKLYIDQIARFKYNTFHWHLTDNAGWRIEIKSLPKLTEVGAWRVPRFGKYGERAAPKPGEAATLGGFYTQADIKEIIQYAQDRNVTIVPEIDVPGHSTAAIAAYPELSCTKDTSIKVNPGNSISELNKNGTIRMLVDNTLNPSDEKVYDFLDKVFTEVASLFPNPYIHVGGDEVYKGFWEKDPGCQALMKKLNMANYEELQAYFMRRVGSILKAKGKKMIAWDEILEGDLPADAILMSWRDIKGGIETSNKKYNEIMTPTNYAYLDFQQGEQTIEPQTYADLRLKKCYTFDPVPDGADAKYILGGQGNLWTEQVVTLHHAEYMSWPRGWALAEDFWSTKESKNWDNFIYRVEKQFGRADIEGVNYAIAIYDAIINVSGDEDRMTLEMDSEAPNLDIYYTIDGSMPNAYSTKYLRPVILPEGPITLRVISYRNGKPIGHLITLKSADLKKRLTK